MFDSAVAQAVEARVSMELIERGEPIASGVHASAVIHDHSLERRTMPVAGLTSCWRSSSSEDRTATSPAFWTAVVGPEAIRARDALSRSGYSWTQVVADRFSWCEAVAL